MELLVITAGILVFSLVSRALKSTPLTLPIFFVAWGFLASSKVFGFVEMGFHGEAIHLLAEITLALVLFTDAVQINIKSLFCHRSLPLRLLGIGLPLCILLGALAAKLFFPELSWLEVGLLAAILAPTDAALGQVVVTSEKVPEQLRESLSVESGLNDGLVFPVVLALAVATTGEPSDGIAQLFQSALVQIALGLVTGVVLGGLCAKLVDFSVRSGWISDQYLKIYTLAIGLTSFSLAEAVGGNGFIAAFVAGIVVGNTARNHCSCMYEFADEEGKLLSMLTFFIFGLVMLPLLCDHLGPQLFGYGLLSLTLVRMLPVWLSLLGSGLSLGRSLFIGWFGPRGLASILFILIVSEKYQLLHEEQLMLCVIATVALSVLLHGITAAPLSNRFIPRANENAR